MNTSQLLKILTLTTGIGITQCALADTKNENAKNENAKSENVKNKNDKKEHGKVAKLDSAFLEYLALTSFEGGEISDPLEMLGVDEESLNASFDRQEEQQGQNDKANPKKVISKSNSEDGTSDDDLQKQKEEK